MAQASLDPLPASIFYARRGREMLAEGRDCQAFLSDNSRQDEEGGRRGCKRVLGRESMIEDYRLKAGRWMLKEVCILGRLVY